jgi:Na+/melibiose symporter-like transporter
MITVGSVIFVFFLITEHFHPLPAMPLHLFKNRTVALVLSTNFLVGIVWFGNFYIAPLYYQNVLGYSAVTAGALMLPLLVGQLFIMVGAGMAVKKWGKSRTMILVGYFIWTAGQGMQIAWPEYKSIALIVIAQLIQSVGFGLTSQTTLVLAQASCAPADRAVVTGMRVGGVTNRHL